MKRRVLSRILSSSLAIGALLPSAAHATQPLEAFLERSKTNAFDTREATATVRQRNSEADVALGRLTPVFSARGVYTRNQYEAAVQLPGSTERLVITPYNQLDAFLQLDVPIIDLASYHRYKASRALAESSSAQKDATTIDVSRSVARAYYQFLGAASLVDSARESIKAAEANLKNVDDRRAAGAATDLDHERAAASLSRAEQDLADAELSAALAARSLETLSGLSPEAAQPFPEDDLHPEGSLNGWLSLAGSTPAQRAQQKLAESAEQNRKAANRALWPTLSGNAQERFTNATGFTGRNSAYTLQLILAWRLDYGTYAGTGAQEAALEVQRVRVERSKRASEDAAFEAFRRVEAGVAKSRAARAQATAATRASSLSEDRYKAGVATQLDVTQAQRDAFLASAAKIQADADLAFARASLRLAAGIPVSDKRPR
ncbi:MAG: TolC family protein [Myxococcales bacterium]|nr:MAG: TolC family protein [Myxococcales bacterium]